MNQYHIRFATIDDVDVIMMFIGQHWKEGHILAVNKAFFLYEYAYGEKVNFAIAIDTLSNDLVGLCGFIQNSQQLSGSTIWGSLWKVIKTNNPMLGINILEFINNNSGCAIFSSCGIAPKTIPIYDYLSFKTGTLQHYYRLNDIQDYKIAKVYHKEIINYDSTYHYKLQLFTNFNDLEINFKQKEYNNKAAVKDNWYLNKRYFNHPVYTYKVFGILNQEIQSLLVTREILHEGVKILRIVDFIGAINDLEYIGFAIENLLKENHYEYIDFYCQGVPSKTMQKLGFKLKDGSDSTIIPNYFEPFIQQNIEIHYFTTSNENIFVFKADGDQDRPSFVSLN